MLLKCLNAVDLRDNRITDDEAKLIAEAMVAAPKLAKLNLAGNRLTSLGLQKLLMAIIKAAKKEVKLSELDLSRNHIIEGGATDGGDALVELAKVASTHALLSVRPRGPRTGPTPCARAHVHPRASVRPVRVRIARGRARRCSRCTVAA